MSEGKPNFVFATSHIETPEMFPQLPALAVRLGVKPAKHGDMGLLLMMKDGTRYNALELVSAMLDMMAELDKRIVSTNKWYK